MKRVFPYLAGTRNLWLSYGEVRHILVRSTDVKGSMAKDRHNARPYCTDKEMDFDRQAGISLSTLVNHIERIQGQSSYKEAATAAL